MTRLPSDNVENSLTISTAHVPSPSPDFGRERVVEHDYGWIVFVSLEGDAPSWLRPILSLAIENECTIVNFDQAATELDNLRTYDW
jgi:hypothetical protein